MYGNILLSNHNFHHICNIVPYLFEQLLSKIKSTIDDDKIKEVLI